MINTIEVRYKGEPVGALSYNKGDTAARFEYLSEFVEKNKLLLWREYKTKAQGKRE
ncbi:hypothetical protein [Idiomarina sp.]|uniref:hypothetical protein n=1 Tax=Idiomarina sp. TaxID=1874361 RepID=UPI0025BC2C0C|nr:hypothetical protein [Idiomarina sp.]